MHDLSGNAKLRPIVDDGEGDVALWNKEIAKYFQGGWLHVLHSSPQRNDVIGTGKDFMNAPWLFAEAYKYRRLHECFSVSKYWKDYDVFFRQKCDTFSRSSQAVFELSTRFVEPWKYAEAEVNGLTAEEKIEAERLMFLELTQGEMFLSRIISIRLPIFL